MKNYKNMNFLMQHHEILKLFDCEYNILNALKFLNLIVL